MTIRRAKVNSNVVEIKDLPLEPRAGAGYANRHLLHRNQSDPEWRRSRSKRADDAMKELKAFAEKPTETV